MTVYSSNIIIEQEDAASFEDQEEVILNPVPYGVPSTDKFFSDNSHGLG
jgi:hypothetical protein